MFIANLEAHWSPKIIIFFELFYFL